MRTREAILLDELRTFAPVDALEASHYVRLVDLLTGEGDAFSRHRWVPGHVTASAFIVDDAGRLLLLHHRRLGRWLQTGGHVEPAELPLAAALREGAEESGLADLQPLGTGILDIDIHAIPPGKGEPDHHHFDVRFLARTKNPGAITMDPVESNDLAWVTLDRAVEMMNEEASTRAIRKIGTLITGRKHT